MIKLIFTISLIIIFQKVFGQKIIDSSSPEKPVWLSDKPKSNIYFYYVGNADSDTLKKSKEIAISDVLKQLSNEGKFSIDVQSESTLKQKITTQNQKENISEAFNITAIVKSTNEKVSIKGLKIEEEYWQLRQMQNGQIKYEYWILMKRPQKEYENNHIIDKQGYGLAPVWRSAIMPGWGQLYKKEKNKGFALLIGEGLLLSGVVVSHIMYSTNIEWANGTTDYKSRLNYIDNADYWFTTRNVCGVIAGVVWIYSIIDSMTSKGAKIYTENKRIEIYPNIAQNNYQVTLKINLK